MQTDSGLVEATVLPLPAGDLEKLADAALQAAFKTIADGLAEHGYPVSGDVAPDEAVRLERHFESFVRAMALNNPTIAEMQGNPIKCKTCGGEVTSFDPVRYPYCRTCHYTGIAAEDERADQLAYFRALLPEASVGIEHTGGGCFWLAVRFGDEPGFYAVTDEAMLPTDDDGNPVRGGWSIVYRYAGDDTDDDYNEDNVVLEAEGEHRFTDEQVVAAIKTDRLKVTA